MTANVGTLVLAGVVPPDTDDTFATHFDTLGAGGWRSVTDVAALADIPTPRRRLGMAVYCVAEGISFVLTGSVDTPTWVPLAGSTTSVNNVNQMLGLTAISVGDFVTTRGYGAAGDGGGALYKIVAAGTGTPDGGSYFDLTGIVGQAEFVHRGVIAGEQFGALTSNGECSAELQAAWYALADWVLSTGRRGLFTFRANVTIMNQVKFANRDGTVAEGINIDMRGSMLTATTGGDLSTTNAVLRIRESRAMAWLGLIDGAKQFCCLDLFGVAGMRFFAPIIRRFKGRGIRVRGATGSMHLMFPNVQEYSQEDVEYPVRANYSAYGIDVEEGDWTLWGGNILFCHRCVYLGANVRQMHAVQCHLVNGNADYPNTAAWVDPVLVESDSAFETHWEDCYWDNGLIFDNTSSMHIIGGHYVNNGAATLTDPFVRLRPTSAGATSAPNVRITDLGGLASVGFVDNGGNTWAGDMTGQAAHYANMRDEDKTVQVRQREYNLYPNDSNVLEVNYKAGGTFQYDFFVGANRVSEIFNPASGEINYNIGSGSFGIRDAGAANNLFVVNSTGQVTQGNNTGARTYSLNGAAGTLRSFDIQSAGVNRWRLRVTSTAEGGSNAGSNFALVANDDAGVAIDNPITIDRAAGGTMTLARPLEVSPGGTQQIVVTSDGRLYGKNLHNNAGAVTGTANQYVASGTYTPTLTNVTNLAASTASQLHWMRVGNVVHVSGQVQIDPTAAGAIELGMSLPIPSDFGSAGRLGGTAAHSSGTAEVFAIRGDITNDRAQFVGNAVDTANHQISFSFSYLVL